MDKETLQAIVEKINEAAASDGVSISVSPTPFRARSHPASVTCWDIELSYKGYHLIENLDSDMRLSKEDAPRIAFHFLRTLFSEYFATKLHLRRT